VIRSYSDHAANERTFRTGIAAIAFGFVIEKFNLFVLTLASAGSVETEIGVRIAKARDPFGRYNGWGSVS
jgi:putative membrane protein